MSQRPLVVIRNCSFDMYIRNYLAAHRKRQGLSIAELATLVGASKTLIFTTERGWSEPRVGLALALQLVLDVPLAELFPLLQDEVEGRVGRAAASLDERLRDRFDDTSLAKLRLIEGIAKRARGADRA